MPSAESALTGAAGHELSAPCTNSGAFATASAHADANDILAWLRALKHPPRTVFVSHGEPDAGDALRIRVRRELGWTAHVLEYLERVDLG